MTTKYTEGSANTRTVSVREVAESIQYGHTASAVPSEEGPRFLRITDIQNGAVDWDHVPSCDIAQEEIPKYRLSEGDLVFARTGATTGKSYLIRNCPDAVFASYLIRVRASKDVDPRYLAFFFQSPDYWQQIERGKRGIGQPNVNGKILGEIQLPVPPLDEQERIVAEIEKQFTRLDAGMASLKRVQSALKRYRASVLKAACEGRLVPTDKKRWRNVTFGELCHVQGGYAFKSSNYQSEGIPLIRISNLVDGEVTLDRKTPRLPSAYVTDYSEFLLRTSDVLIAMSGATTGKMATFMLNEPALLNQRVGRFIIKADADAIREYLALVVEQIARQVLRDAYGAAQPNISPKKIEAMNLAIPPMAEQTKIVADVERRVSVVEELYQAIAFSLRRAARLRQSVLNVSFGGVAKRTT